MFLIPKALLYITYSCIFLLHIICKKYIYLKNYSIKYNDGLHFQILFKIVFKYNSKEDTVPTFIKELLVK